MDLEAAAEVAIVKIKDLSAHVDKAEAALAALEETLDDVKERYETDRAALDEKARALLERAHAHTSAITGAGQEAREALARLDDSLEKTATEWDQAIADAASVTASLGTHVSEQCPAVSAQAHEAGAAARGLAERAAAIEAQLQAALAEVREVLESQLANDLREAQDAVRERSLALRAALSDECEAELAEAFAAWEQQLAQVEEVIDEEFARARTHAADVVAFSLEECERGHEEAWSAMAGSISDLDGLLQRLGETVAARTAEVGAQRGAGEQAFADAQTAVERMRSALARELETLARYAFVGAARS